MHEKSTVRQLVVVARMRGCRGGSNWSRRWDDGRWMGDNGADRRWRRGRLLLLLVEREEASLVRGWWLRRLISAVDGPHGFPARCPGVHTYGSNAATQVCRSWRRRHLFPDCTSTGIPYWQWLLQYLQHRDIEVRFAIHVESYISANLTFTKLSVLTYGLIHRQNCALSVARVKVFAFIQ